MSPGPLTSQYVPVKYDKKEQNYGISCRKRSKEPSHNSKDYLFIWLFVTVRSNPLFFASVPSVVWRRDVELPNGQLLCLTAPSQAPAYCWVPDSAHQQPAANRELEPEWWSCSKGNLLLLVYPHFPFTLSVPSVLILITSSEGHLFWYCMNY